jgi:hypothetical protein
MIDDDNPQLTRLIRDVEKLMALRYIAIGGFVVLTAIGGEMVKILWVVGDALVNVHDTQIHQSDSLGALDTRLATQEHRPCAVPSKRTDLMVAR